MRIIDHEFGVRADGMKRKAGWVGTQCVTHQNHLLYPLPLPLGEGWGEGKPLLRGRPASILYLYYGHQSWAALMPPLKEIFFISIKVKWKRKVFPHPGPLPEGEGIWGGISPASPIEKQMDMLEKKYTLIG